MSQLIVTAAERLEHSGPPSSLLPTEREDCLHTLSITPFEIALHDEMVDRARALRPMLTAHAQTHEETGELADATITALEGAGMFSLAAPKRWGGFRLSSRNMADVVRELAKGCPSAAWVVAIANACTGAVATMGPAVQEIVFADGVPRICSPTAGSGQLEWCGDHHVLSGRWAYGSGSHHAKWAIVPAVTEDDARVVVLMPMASAIIERTWQVVGLKGTGSDTVIAVKVAIGPGQVSRPIASATDEVAAITWEREATDYWLGIPLLRTLAFGVLLGAADAILELAIATGDRPVANTTIGKRSESPLWQAGIGKASAKIGGAAAIVDRHNRDNDDTANAGARLTHAARAECRAETAVAAELVRSAVEEMMDLQGSSAFVLRSDVQRYWRDFNTGIRHALFDMPIGYAVHGKAMLGLEPHLITPEQV